MSLPAALCERIRSSVQALQPFLVETRRDFHREAERGWMEFRTASRAAALLEEAGWRVGAGRAVVHEGSRMGLPPPGTLEEAFGRALERGAAQPFAEAMRGGFTGVVGTLEGSRPGPTIAVRVDIDANDGTEDRTPEHRPAREGFASVNPGAQHNCGHDGHTAMGLGLAKALAGMREALRGRIKLVFQPAEEGARGALSMVNAGVLDDVDRFLAIHLGVIAPRTGQVVCGSYGFQATTKFDVRFVGRAAHAGLAPEEGRNALLAAVTAVQNLYGISRHAKGDTRVNVGVLQSGEGRNIIPARALMKLETRGLTTELDAYMQDRAMRILRAAADMNGVEIEIDRVGHSGSAASDPELIQVIRAAARETPGVAQIEDTHPYGASDDAALMMARVQARGGKAAYMIVGSDLADGHHTPRFDFDEAALPTGVHLLATTILRLMYQEE